MIVYGIDIGTTTLRAMAVEMKAGPLGQKQVKALGEPFCDLTPYDDNKLLEESILNLLTEWATTVPFPDLGTLLFTGEAQRAHNCREVADRITTLWPGLFSAQLDPDHETKVAAHGAHAVTLSASRLGSPVVHFDVGGGTTNVAWIENGEIRDTACLDLGARKWICATPGRSLLRRTQQGIWIEESLGMMKAPEKLTGDLATRFSREIADRIFNFSATDPRFVIVPWKTERKLEDAKILSFSGGVVECLGMNDFVFGDIGPWLGKALVEKARILKKEIHISSEAGRATAFGVSTFGFQLSGNSLFHSEGATPLGNVPIYSEVEVFTDPTPPQLAIVLHEVNSDDLLEKSHQWATWLEKNKPEHVVLLMKPNLAKSLGYLLHKIVPDQRLYVIDEIDPPEVDGCTVRPTVDIRPTPEGDRFSVVIKQLRLF